MCQNIYDNILLLMKKLIYIYTKMYLKYFYIHFNVNLHYITSSHSYIYKELYIYLFILEQ